MSRYRVRIENPVMGVPITFLDKFNPDQFEIVGGDCEWSGSRRLEAPALQEAQRAVVGRVSCLSAHPRPQPQPREGLTMHVVRTVVLDRAETSLLAAVSRVAHLANPEQESGDRNPLGPLMHPYATVVQPQIAAATEHVSALVEALDVQRSVEHWTQDGTAEQHAAVLAEARESQYRQAVDALALLREALASLDPHDDNPRALRDENESGF